MLLLYQLNRSETRIDQLSNQLQEAERQRNEAEHKCKTLQSELSDKEREADDSERRLRTFHDEVVGPFYVFLKLF